MCGRGRPGLRAGRQGRLRQGRRTSPRIKTFSVKIGTSWNNPLSEKRVLAEIEQALAEKGWTKAEADKADAIVVVARRDREAEDAQHLLLRRRIRRIRLARVCGMGWAWVPPPPPPPSTSWAPWSWTSSTRSRSSSCTAASPRTSSRTSRRRTQKKLGQGLGQAVQGLPARIEEEVVALEEESAAASLRGRRCTLSSSQEKPLWPGSSPPCARTPSSRSS